MEIDYQKYASVERLGAINSLIKTVKESQTADIETARHTLYLSNKLRFGKTEIFI